MNNRIIALSLAVEFIPGCWGTLHQFSVQQLRCAFIHSRVLARNTGINLDKATLNIKRVIEEKTA